MKLLKLSKRKFIVFVISAAFLLFVFLLCWLYIFDTYEVKYEFNYIGRKSISIVGIPLNAFGKTVPMKTVSSTFRILDSKKCFNIESVEKDKAIISWSEEDVGGKIKISAKNPLSRWENIITIPIKISEEI